MKNSPFKRIAALLGVVLLLGLVVATFIVAVFLPEKSQLLAALIGAMIGVPILLWLLIYVGGKVKEARKSHD
ncbi:MAG: hypothetical protein LBC96_06810 [Lachnospiraceae bacterium]|jgi:uncharacterized membrane protein|nr:hypothetical protein [Lachnospiraceae bacterium]